MQYTENSALDRLALLGMDDMPVLEYIPRQCNLDKNWFQKYIELRREFLSSLSDSIEEITFMNLSQEEFIGLLTGKSIPQNTSLRFRIPLTLGGQLTLDNLFLCLTFPHSHNIDRFIIEQSDANTLYLPNPAKKIYITTHTTGGPGGNAASDRLSQTALNLNSGRGNE